MCAFTVAPWLCVLGVQVTGAGVSAGRPGAGAVSLPEGGGESVLFILYISDDDRVLTC